ncbi:hypothetical protein DFJ58DRAFT_852804 [Suillus subalutaceus]|uniref:uncharacterized protein n=1 Tax=Suillus subalutaceus TaxID=48586 RepID=UPI001B85CD17|nr:uncharacterized protein DFJ58DRAFT_852804 [Suillus subalutaceus]KAG1844615.1 hypothetical protein DFJ58DRAFT_852804 [Suillus subalutaceus]
MLPKVHLTSDVVSHFVHHTLLQEDPMKLGIKMESTVLAGLAPQSVLSMSYTDRKLAAKQGIRSGLNESLVKVTVNVNTTLEFVRYERMVQDSEHLVKLVGWCHNEWGNPSNLKGLFEITRQQADEHMKRIEAGEILTPNKIDQEPESPVDDDDTYEGNAPITASLSPTSAQCIMPSRDPTTPIHDNISGPAPSSPPSIPNVSAPSPPLTTENSTPSGTHTEPHLPNIQLPTDNPFLPTPSASNTTSSPAEVLAGLTNTEPRLPNTQLPTSNPFLPTPSASNTTSSPAEVLPGLTNHKRGAPQIANRVPSKRKRKLTEKAALYVASRKSRKLKRGANSSSVVDSDEENGWEDIDDTSTH